MIFLGAATLCLISSLPFPHMASFQDNLEFSQYNLGQESPDGGLYKLREIHKQHSSSFSDGHFANVFLKFMMYFSPVINCPPSSVRYASKEPNIASLVGNDSNRGTPGVQSPVFANQFYKCYFMFSVPSANSPSGYN